MHADDCVTANNAVNGLCKYLEGVVITLQIKMLALYSLYTSKLYLTPNLALTDLSMQVGLGLRPINHKPVENSLFLFYGHNLKDIAYGLCLFTYLPKFGHIRNGMTEAMMVVFYLL